MLPIRCVVLFKHGIACFERRGEVEGSAEVKLRFQSSEMNDVLKSLVVADLGGGHVQSIGYEAAGDEARKLERSPFRLTPGEAMTALLRQLEGAPVRIDVSPSPVQGRLLGVESVMEHTGSGVAERRYVGIATDEGSLSRHAMEDVRGIEVLDEVLRRELDHLFAAAIASKQEEHKEVTVFARGEGKRSLVVGYTIEAPVWKTSYRVDLDDAANQTSLEGWALVDNTTDEDWEDVELTLVAGLPISFVHDLIHPRYRTRPVVEVEDDVAYAPPVVEDGMAFGGGAMDDAEEQVMMAEMAAPAPAKAAPMGRSRGRRASKKVRQESVEVATSTEERGDQFEYAIDHPVTVRRGQSGLVPILRHDFEGRSVLLYDPSVREANPMAALRLDNTTAMTLEGGPMTVHIEGAYVGEAMLSTLRPGQKQFAPYAVELSCKVSREPGNTRELVHRWRLHGGVLVFHRYVLHSVVYNIETTSDRERVLFLTHRFQPGYTLHETQDPEERTESSYRFKVQVPAKGQVSLSVVERGEQHESFHLQQLTDDQLKVWVAQKDLSESLRSSLNSVAEVNAQLVEVQGGIRELDETLASLAEDQNRLRENLRSLGSTGSEQRFRDRIVASLESSEDSIMVVQGQKTTKMVEEEALRKGLAQLVASLQFDVKA